MSTNNAINAPVTTFGKSLMDAADAAAANALLGDVTSITGTANELTASSPSGAVTIALASNPHLPGTGSVALPSGTTAQQAGIAGSIRFNSQTSVFESTVDGVVWATIETSANGVISIIGTANQIHVSSATGNVTISLVDNAVLPGTGGVTLPSGNTAARGAVAGSIRFNSQTNVVELTNDGTNWYTVETSSTGVTSVTGTTNRITSTGGTTPVIDISASYVGQSSITTVGTVTNGTWNGTVIDVPHGGSGLSTTTVGYAPICAGNTATSSFNVASTGIGTSGFVLTSNGAAAVPSFQAAPGAGSSLYIKVPMTESQFRASASVPVLLLAAPGASSAYIVTAWALEVSSAGSTFNATGGTKFGIQNSAGTFLTNVITMNATTVTYGINFVDTQPATNTVETAVAYINEPLYFANHTGDLTGGTGRSAAIHLYYTIISTL